MHIQEYNDNVIDEHFAAYNKIGSKFTTQCKATILLLAFLPDGREEAIITNLMYVVVLSIPSKPIVLHQMILSYPSPPVEN